MFESLSWKLHRLSRMGAAEILYRMKQAAQVRIERKGFALARAQEPSAGSGNPWCAVPTKEVDVANYRAAADRVLAGRFDIFALRDVVVGFPPEWNRDPKTGTVAPITFGKTINYRDERIVGDIKYLW